MQCTGRLAKLELSGYSHAGAIAEEVIAGIRTVVALRTQRLEVERWAGRKVL